MSQATLDEEPDRRDEPGSTAAMGAPGLATMLQATSAGVGSGVLQRKLVRRLIQRRSARRGEAEATDARRAAEHGLRGSPEALPFRDRIQASFGGHDLRRIRAHVGGAAAEASDRLGAEAYASGDAVAFRTAPDLHTAAHEAAHVVQQRAGVPPKAGVGEERDAYERAADAVADRVVAGQPAADLLPRAGGVAAAGAAPAGGAVQRKIRLAGADLDAAAVHRTADDLVRNQLKDIIPRPV